MSRSCKRQFDTRYVYLHHKALSASNTVTESGFASLSRFQFDLHRTMPALSCSKKATLTGRHMSSVWFSQEPSLSWGFLLLFVSHWCRQVTDDANKKICVSRFHKKTINNCHNFGSLVDAWGGRDRSYPLADPPMLGQAERLAAGRVVQRIVGLFWGLVCVDAVDSAHFRQYVFTLIFAFL